MPLLANLPEEARLLLVEHIPDNTRLNGEAIRLDGVIHIAAK